MCGIPPSWILIVAGFAVTIMLRNYFKNRRAEKPKPLVSLVFLLSAPRTLTRQEIVQATEKAFGTIDADAAVQVTKRPNLFVIHASATRLGLINAAKPYVTDIAETADRIRDFRCKRAVQDHRAWLAVDHVGDVPDAESAYRPIGKLMAELAGDDCLAIYCPETGQMNSYAADLIPLLRSEVPLSALTKAREDKTVPVDSSDVEMAEAIAEAKRRWPEFLEAFARRRPMQGFAVKAAFCQNDQAEHMWVEVSTVEGDVVRGTLANEPNVVKTLRLSDRVAVNLADVEDWIYSDGKQMVGGFTSAVLARRK